MRLESKPVANQLLYVLIVAVGALLMFLARDFRQGGSNVLCGFLLGGLLFVVGLLALIIAESRIVELDEQRNRIMLDIKRRIGGSRQVIIPFSEILEIGILMQGKASAGSRFYDVQVKCKGGRNITLFGGCVFEGRMSREWAEGIRHTLETAVVKKRNRIGDRMPREVHRD